MTLPNLPNSLTILRIFLVPVMAVVLLTKQPNWPIHFEAWGVLILLLAAATDLMDGYFARKRREVTTLGILLDPIADKLLILATFVPLVQMGLMRAWMAVLILGREFIVQGLREIASVEGLVIPAGVLGKTKMFLQVIAGCAVILTANHPALRPLGTALLWLVVIMAVGSAVHYFMNFWGQIRFRVEERRRKTVFVERKEKNLDGLTR
jgi:CDP-diacylglycerol---glycerol-3-phosphate 3-phosphatidyltransferase